MPTGPSTSTPTYIVNLEPNVQIVPILTAGDALPGSTTGVLAGLLDGMGAFDNGDGTMTVLVAHEIRADVGVPRDHGAIGAFIDAIIVDQGTLQVISGDDAIQTLNVWDDANDVYVTASSAIGRLCSADLAEPTAFFDATTGLGTDARIFLAGEEVGAEGRAFATIVSGPNAGMAYELPFLGNLSFENVVANPYAQTKTIVAVTDDVTGGQVYLYVGDKQASGNEIERAGLAGGTMYGVAVSGIAAESNGTIANGTFTLQAINNASNLTGAEIETASDAAGVTEFLRPEDCAWDPDQPIVLYFVTTNGFAAPSRLYKLTFTDVANPELGGTIEAVLDGTEGQQMFDNITVSNGKVILQEDPGNQSYLARIWEYDIASDTLNAVAQFDPAQFTPGEPGFITQDEESSGVIDVTGMLGDADTRAFLIAAQVHASNGDPQTVEPGQLSVMYINDVPASGSVDADVLNGDFNANTITGLRGADTINGGSGADSLSGALGDDELNGGNGDDVLSGGWGQDVIFGDAGNDRVLGGGDGDWLAGGTGQDTVLGGTGNDTLNGNEDNDLLFGGAGDDVLNGGAGADSLYGGLRADTFIFAAGDSDLVQVDTIIGFRAADGDRIDLSSMGITAGEIQISHAGGINWSVSIDSNSDTVADMSLTVISGPALTIADFVL